MKTRDDFESDQAYEAALSATLETLRKRSPNWKLQEEFGRLLMIHINDLTPQQRRRYDLLSKILIKPTI